MTEFLIPLEPPAPPPDDRWTTAGRSPITAAILALVGIGSFYFLVQIIFALGGILLSVHDFSAILALRDTLLEGGAGFDALVAPIRWAVMLSQYLALLLPAVLLIRMWHTRKVANYVRFRSAPALDVLIAMVGTVLLIPIGAVLTSLLRGGNAAPSDLDKITEKLFTAYSTPEFLFLVFVVAITPAICEEFFFRGYVQRTFERTLGAHSVPIVGMIFAMFHMQPAGLLTLGLIGTWLGFIYYRSKSMLPNMAAHFTNNFVAIAMVYYAPVIFGVDLKNDDEFPVMWAVCAVPLLVGVVWLYVIRTRELPRPSGRG